MKKLPIGLQNLKEIITENYLYIDKTKIAYDMIEGSGKYYFLSRPRRFGKTLFVDTLKEIFSGNKELFKGLYIYDNYSWEKKYPIINISFAKGNVYSEEDFEEKIKIIIKENMEELGIDCDKTLSPSGCLGELIKNAFKKYNQKVVILIDEYDKPILDNLKDTKLALKMRDRLRDFYSVIKGSDEYLRFAFLTGVSKFSKASIFSGLNNIEDISLSKNFGNICGYTQNDIETSFLPYLDGVDLEELKEWYNGYNFLGDSVYNPFDILLFIKNNHTYDNYWFETGTPSFLIEMIKKNNYYLPNFEGLTVGKELVSSFDIEDLSVETLLFQTGYLTIKEFRKTPRGGFRYVLAVPNKEVQISLNDVLIDYLTKQNAKKADFQDYLYLALEDRNIEKVKEILVSIFASIPYNNFTKNDIANYEGFYASVIYTYLASLGIKIIAEDVTNKGRIDLTIFIGEYIYILEFKVGKENALNQIKEKNYAQKYKNEDKSIVLLGINFDEEEKNISKLEWEEI